MQHSFFFHGNYDILLRLSHPDRQRKGGVPFGFNNFFLGFCHGKCCQPPHLQMVR